MAHEQDAGALFTLLTRALRLLEVSNSRPALDLWVQLRFLSLLGVKPELHQCCLCGSPEVKCFHAQSGGMLCSSCSPGRARLSPPALAALRRLQECRVTAVEGIRLESEVVGAAAPLLLQVFEAHCFETRANV